MSFQNAPVTYILILANLYFSYMGFKDVAYFEKNMFLTSGILHRKQYARLISSGFLHANWPHLFFNMFSLYSFGESMEMNYGTFFFSCVYFSALLGGNLLSLFMHREEPNYSAIGASGAVSGVLFSSVLLFPDMRISMFFIPIGIPGWVFAALYTLYSIYGIRAQHDNIGHDAHLGGAIVGTLVTIAFFPILLQESPLVIISILLPTSLFFFLLLRMPHVLGVDQQGVTNNNKVRFDDDMYNHIRAEKQKELDRILEKINSKGIDSLTETEKRFLDLNR